jgi:flagellar basal body rod protein FlgG
MSYVVLVKNDVGKCHFVQTTPTKKQLKNLNFFVISTKTVNIANVQTEGFKGTNVKNINSALLDII